mgnify:CR=1 FL=1
MCRMIAAVGRFKMKDLLEALKLMASNGNPDHDHEFKSRGAEFEHDCGWGVAWLDGDQLESRRSSESCIDDPSFSADQIRVAPTEMAQAAERVPGDDERPLLARALEERAHTGGTARARVIEALDAAEARIARETRELDAGGGTP